MSDFHEKNRASALAAIAADPASSDRADQRQTRRADVAVPAAPPIPHGGESATAGLRELRNVVGDVVSGVASNVRGFWNPPVKAAPPVATAGYSIPSCLRVAKLTGGSATIGYSLHDIEGVVPAFVSSIADLVVEEVSLRDSHDLVDVDIERRLIAAHSTQPSLAAEDRPEVVARLIQVLKVETIALRTYVRSTVDVWGDPRLPRLVTTLLRWLVQELRLDSAAAAHEFLREWRAPLEVATASGRPFLDVRAVEATTRLLDYARLDATSLAMLAGGLAREAFVYGGQTHATIAEAVSVERDAHVAAVKTNAAREAHLDTVRSVTPRGAKLIIARRLDASSARVENLRVGAPATEVRIGDHACIIRRRTWPPIDMPRAVLAGALNGAPVTYEVLADDEPIDLSERVIERATRSPAPRFVLEGVLAAARARVAKLAPHPITEFVSMRDRSEAKRRLAVLRAHLELVADIYKPGCDPYTAPLDQAVVLQLATVGLRLDPALVEHELRKHSPRVDVLEECFAIARDPASWICVPDAAVT
jgi:hypothetical protein